MRKHITIGIKVTARQCEFLPKSPGKERAIRGKWYGLVVEFVEDNNWVVSCDILAIDDGKVVAIACQVCECDSPTLVAIVSSSSSTSESVK